MEYLQNSRWRQPFRDSKTFTKPLYYLTANYKIQENLAVYIDASQVLGNVVVARLMATPACVAELEAARAELTAAHIAP